MKILGYFGTLMRNKENANSFIKLYQQAMNKAESDQSAIIKEGNSYKSERLENDELIKRIFIGNYRAN